MYHNFNLFTMSLAVFLLLQIEWWTDNLNTIIPNFRNYLFVRLWCVRIKWRTSFTRYNILELRYWTIDLISVVLESASYFITKNYCTSCDNLVFQFGVPMWQFCDRFLKTSTPSNCSAPSCVWIGVNQAQYILFYTASNDQFTKIIHSLQIHFIQNITIRKTFFVLDEVQWRYNVSVAL